MVLYNKENPPFPVLTGSSKDYNEGIEFHIEITDDIKMENDNFVIQAKYSLNSAKLTELINKKEAECGLNICCDHTFFERVYPFDENQTIRLELPKETLQKRFKVIGQVITNDTLDHPYKDEELDMDYFKGIRFMIKKKSILAFDASIPMIYLDPSALKTQVTSIFNISSSGKTTEPVSPKYDYEGDIFKIIVNDNTYNSYNIVSAVMKGALVDNTILAIVKSALVKALSCMREDNGALIDYLWYGVISNKLKEMNINLNAESDEDIAEKLLGKNLTEKGLKCLEELVKNSIETEEE